MKVLETGIKLESGWDYTLDKKLNIIRESETHQREGEKPEVVLITGIKPEKGMRYYVDLDGDVSCYQEDTREQAKAQKWFQKLKKVLNEMPDDVSILLVERCSGMNDVVLYDREELVESFEEADDLFNWSGPEDYIDKFETKANAVFVNNHAI